MNTRTLFTLGILASSAFNSGCGILWGCKHAEVTAVSLNPCDGKLWGKEAGIPFYLPKPLLVVSKNVRNIEEAKTGLTDTVPIPTGFDDQAKYADLNARTNFAGLQTPIDAKGEPNAGPVAAGGNGGEPKPGASDGQKSGPYLHSASPAPLSPNVAPSDGLSPKTFYTYQIVFVPDMSQKYALRIKGGPGEIRAAMNLVNGWQFTGLGPFYLKDSATAQNILASGISARLGGQAAADVLHASAALASAAGVKPGGLNAGAIDSDNPAVANMVNTFQALPLGMCVSKIENFAEIHVYEPNLTPDGRMEWSEIVNLSFDRDYLGYECHAPVAKQQGEPLPQPKTLDDKKGADAGKLNAGQVGNVVQGVNSDLGRAALGAVFGIQTPSQIRRNGGGLNAGPIGALNAGEVAPQPVPATIGGINQIQVDCDGKCDKTSKQFNLFNFGGSKHKAEPLRPVISQRALLLPGTVNAGPAAEASPSSLTPPNTKKEPVRLNAGEIDPRIAPAAAPVINQTFNQNANFAGETRQAVPVPGPASVPVPAPLTPTPAPSPLNPAPVPKTTANFTDSNDYTSADALFDKFDNTSHSGWQPSTR